MKRRGRDCLRPVRNLDLDSRRQIGNEGIQTRFGVQWRHRPHIRRFGAGLAGAAAGREGAPNVLYIVLDDTGFGQLGCFGSPINTPNIDKLADNGLRYTNMHTTALCSPTRSCIMNGRNHHSNAMACITEGSTVTRLQRQYSLRKWIPL